MLMGSGTGDFFWMPSGSISDPNVPNPMASPSQTTVYYLTTTSEYGCQSIDSMLLTVIFDPIVEFPTAFSPNNDGVNDLFGVIVRGPVDIQAYRIYNRWGEVVFESTDPEGAWDGTHKGQMQDVGTYVFHFAGTDPNGMLIERHGTLTLVR
jgi:gliding motility-associated-like protein